MNSRSTHLEVPARRREIILGEFRCSVLCPGDGEAMACVEGRREGATLGIHLKSRDGKWKKSHLFLALLLRGKVELQGEER